MQQLSRIQIKGFRRLYDVALDMRPFMVMIGANGVGKTSILEVFSLLSSSAAGGLNQRLNELGGVAGVMTNGKAKGISFELDMEVPNYEPLRYDLAIVPKDTTYAIESESLSQPRFRARHEPEPFKHIDSHYSDIKYFEIAQKHLVRPTWDHNHFETSLSQVPKMYKEPESLRRTLSSSTLYHVLNVEGRAPIRLPQQMKPAVLPGKDGEDIVPLLYYLRETDRERFHAIEDTLRAAFPGFESLLFPPVAAGMLTMTWKEKYFNDPLYPNQLSEGMLRFLWLAALLQSPGLSSVTMIDEPEVSLHPEMLSLLVDLMREASQKTQLIIATHSDRLVRFLKPKEVVVMDMDESGLAKATWADELDLREWLADYSLDEVWGKGRMGGRACESPS